MSTATLNGIAVTRCCVSLPAWGVPFYDVEIDRAETLSGAVTLVLLDKTFVGTVMSGGPWQGRARYRIAGGAGKWGKTIFAQSYANDAGVKLAKVVSDAAAACGEKVGAVPAGSVGGAYARAEGPAVCVLEELVPRGWYVDEAGVTQIGRRPASTYAGGATRIKADLAQGTIELAPSAIADLLPGIVVDGIEAVDVDHVLDAGKLRTTLWGRGIADSSRLSTAFARIVEAFTGHHRYFAAWEYRVVQRSGERLDLQVARVSSGMPDLRNVPVRPGVSGCKSHPKLGSLVLVSFVNGDPARPFVSGFDDPDSPGFVPDDIYLQAGATGTEPTEHATSAESMLVAVQNGIAAVGAAIAGAGGAAAYLGATISALANDGPFAAIVATIAGASLGPTTKTAIATALAAKSADSSGDSPSLGWPHVRGG